MEAYGFASLDVNDVLSNLLALNQVVYDKEQKGEKVTAPDLPSYITNKEDFIDEECVRFEWE